MFAWVLNTPLLLSVNSSNMLLNISSLNRLICWWAFDIKTTVPRKIHVYTNIKVIWKGEEIVVQNFSNLVARAKRCAWDTRLNFLFSLWYLTMFVKIFDCFKINRKVAICNMYAYFWVFSLLKRKNLLKSFTFFCFKSPKPLTVKIF